jgi:hypothetical protein
MAKAHGRTSKFSLDNSGGTPVDISAYVDNVQLQDGVDMNEVSTLGDNAREYLEGLAGATINCSGPYDSTLWTQLVALKQLGTSSTFTYSPQGTAASSPKATGECWLSSLQFNTQVGSPVGMSFTLQVTGAVTYGAH